MKRGRPRGKGGRFRKGGYMRKARRSPRRSARRAPVAATAAPAVRRIRYYSRPGRRVRARHRRAVRPIATRVRSGRIIGAAIAGVAAGAMLGATANESGLLMSMPSQNKIGIAATGLVGIVLVIIGVFVRSEGLKLLFYGLGGGLIIEEITRQIEMRFYDFRVAFGTAPPLDYSQGVSGASLQLAAIAANPAAAAAGTPTVTVTPAPGASSTPIADKAKSASVTPKALPSQSSKQSVDAALSGLTQDDLPLIEQNMKGGQTFKEAVKTRLFEKGTPVETFGIGGTQATNPRILLHSRYASMLRDAA